MIQLSDIDFRDEERDAVVDVLNRKWLSLGPETERFENSFSQALSVDHSVCVSSCTAALHLALMAHGIGPTDEVIVPSYTFVASANSILYQNATPVFVDILGPHDLNLAPADLENRITPKTKAIIAVHLAGFTCDMDTIMTLARKHDLIVIEDACHAIGTQYPADSQFAGRHAGTAGDVGCFSFFSNKNLVTGEGGMLVSNNRTIAQSARLSRSHGMTKNSWDKATGRATDYDVAQLGFNYRCSEITAALGSVQLTRLAENNVKRTEIAERYRAELSGQSGISIPFLDRDARSSSGHIFPILVDQPDQRQQFRERLKERQVQTSVHYPPIHQFSHYVDLLGDVDGLENTERVSQREVTLPLHPLLSDADINTVCDAVRQSLS